MYPYLAAAIGKGASRNILICGITSTITEALIREQLDHIHNLVVLSVRFYQRNAYISTNSIHNAMYARSCLMSRAIYKGMKICYFQDECVRPIHEHLQRATEQPTVRRSENTDRSANRYQVLTVDGSYELEEDSDDAISSPAPFDERLLSMMGPNVMSIWELLLEILTLQGAWSQTHVRNCVSGQKLYLFHLLQHHNPELYDYSE